MNRMQLNKTKLKRPSSYKPRIKQYPHLPEGLLLKRINKGLKKHQYENNTTHNANDTYKKRRGCYIFWSYEVI